MSGPPEWKNADSCHKCNGKFTLINRKHHCRNCGNTFCGKDTSKKCGIPEYGITESARVCDECYDMIESTTRNTKDPLRSNRNTESSSKQTSKNPLEEAAPKTSAPVTKQKKVKQCVCNMPLCICPDPEQEPEEKEATRPVKQEVRKQSKASTNYSQAQVGTFAGFGRPEKRVYDLSGNLNEQCREAVKAGDLDGVKQLLGAGASAKYEDRTGNTLLHLAAMFNRLDLVEALVKAGGDLTRRNPDKETPADLAPPSLQSKIKIMMAAQ
eukprot:gb/GEZN01011247.1/.p1 GENE.gb/GEZN01011247.1/~~gb/GEZN01011247.1/.p1  ORF type:complete len:268 (-),score=43.12 gb/GEZN01011247.1/:332-1135(-)